MTKRPHSRHIAHIYHKLIFKVISVIRNVMMHFFCVKKKDYCRCIHDNFKTVGYGGAFLN